jgi:hypothetical protein
MLQSVDVIAKNILTALGPGLRRGDDEEDKSRGEHPTFLPAEGRNTFPGQRWACAGVTRKVWRAAKDP